MKMKPRRTPFYLLAGIFGLALSGCSATLAPSSVDLAPEIIALNASTDDEGKTAYTVTFKDGTTTTFTVENGKDGASGAPGNGIKSIAKTKTEGLVDTYTITFTDGTSTTFTVTNGSSGTVAPAAYSLSFDVNGGTMPADFLASDYQSIEKGTSVKLPLPTREGGAFLGWYTGVLPTDGVFSSSTPVTRDLSLIAKWANYADPTLESTLSRLQESAKSFFYTPSASYIGGEVVAEYNEAILTYVGRIGFCFDQEELDLVAQDLDWYYAIPASDSIKSMFKSNASSAYDQFSGYEQLVVEFQDEYDALYGKIDAMETVRDAMNLDHEFFLLRNKVEDRLFVLRLPVIVDKVLENFEWIYSQELSFLEKLGIDSYIEEIERYKQALYQASSEDDYNARCDDLDGYARDLFYGGTAFEGLREEVRSKLQAELDGFDYRSDLADKYAYFYLFDRVNKYLELVGNASSISDVYDSFVNFHSSLEELMDTQEQYLAGEEEQVSALAYIDEKIAELENLAFELGYDLTMNDSFSILNTLRVKIEESYYPGDFEAHYKWEIDDAFMLVKAEIETATAEDAEALLAEKKTEALNEVDASFAALQAYAEEKGYAEFNDLYGSSIDDFRSSIENAPDLYNLYSTLYGIEEWIAECYRSIDFETAPRLFVVAVDPIMEPLPVTSFVSSFEVREGEYFNITDHFGSGTLEFAGYYADPEFTELLSDEPEIKADFSIYAPGETLYAKFVIVNYYQAAGEFTAWYFDIFQAFLTDVSVDDFKARAEGVVDEASYNEHIAYCEEFVAPRFVEWARQTLAKYESDPDKAELVAQAEAMLETCDDFDDMKAVNEIINQIVDM